MQDILKEIQDQGITVVEMEFTGHLRGLYMDGVIIVEARLTDAEKRVILTEELMHHYTAVGNILGKREARCVKLEKIARSLTCDRLMPIEKLVEAYVSRVETVEDFANFCDVTVEFVHEAYDYYKHKYGVLEHQGYLLDFCNRKIEKIGRGL